MPLGQPAARERQMRVHPPPPPPPPPRGCSLLLIQGASGHLLLSAPGTLDKTPVCIFTAGLEVLVCTHGRAHSWHWSQPTGWPLGAWPLLPQAQAP